MENRKDRPHDVPIYHLQPFKPVLDDKSEWNEVYIIIWVEL